VFAFVTTLAIIFREGLEAALLIFLLLAGVQKAGGGVAQRRAVHIGWLVAVGVGVLTWFVADYIFTALGGARREWIEGVVSILAALVLFVVSHFVLVKADARRRVKAIRDRLQETLRSGKSAIWLASVGFIAVFREAFETVLFLQALVLDAHTPGGVVLLGALAGTALLIVIVYLLIRLGRRLNPGRVLSLLGGMMCALSIIMTGKGVRSLQEAGAVGQTIIGTLRIEILGIYPTFETIAAQVAMAFAFAVLALQMRTRPAQAS
jgi:high-affinity iron transporter